MKTLLGTARNHSLHILDVDGERKLVPATEVVLMLTEPQYAQAEEGKIVKYPECETVRFYSTPSSLRAMSKNLAMYADEAEEAFGQIAIDHGMDFGEDEVDEVEVPEDEIGENGRIDYEDECGDDISLSPIPHSKKLAKEIVDKVSAAVEAEKAAKNLIPSPTPPLPGIEPEPAPTANDLSIEMFGERYER